MLPLKPFGERIANEILMYFRAQKKNAQDVSLSDFIEASSDGSALALMDVVADETDLTEQVETRETVDRLKAALTTCLTQQERQVIMLRYGIDGGTSHRQREVAQLTGISRSYVSRIEKRALEKLKAALE